MKNTHDLLEYTLLVSGVKLRSSFTLYLRTSQIWYLIHGRAKLIEISTLHGIAHEIL